MQDARSRMPDKDMKKAKSLCLMPGKDMKKAKSFKDLDIFVIAKKLTVAVHRMTLDELPKHEMYETGS